MKNISESIKDQQEAAIDAITFRESLINNRDEVAKMYEDQERGPVRDYVLAIAERVIEELSTSDTFQKGSVIESVKTKNPDEILPYPDAAQHKTFEYAEWNHTKIFDVDPTVAYSTVRIIQDRLALHEDNGVVTPLIVTVVLDLIDHPYPGSVFTNVYSLEKGRRAEDALDAIKDKIPSKLRTVTITARTVSPLRQNPEDKAIRFGIGDVDYISSNPIVEFSVQIPDSPRRALARAAGTLDIWSDKELSRQSVLGKLDEALQKFEIKDGKEIISSDVAITVKDLVEQSSRL